MSNQYQQYNGITQQIFGKTIDLLPTAYFFLFRSLLDAFTFSFRLILLVVWISSSS